MKHLLLALSVVFILVGSSLGAPISLTLDNFSSFTGVNYEDGSGGNTDNTAIYNENPESINLSHTLTADGFMYSVLNPSVQYALDGNEDIVATFEFDNLTAVNQSVVFMSFNEGKAGIQLDSSGTLWSWSHRTDEALWPSEGGSEQIDLNSGSFTLTKNGDNVIFSYSSLLNSLNYSWLYEDIILEAGSGLRFGFSLGSYAPDQASVSVTGFDFEMTAPAPVPEPSTILLLGSGLLGLGWYGRKRKKA